jgi:hypothetical protein
LRAWTARWRTWWPRTTGLRPVEQGEGDSFVVAFGRASDAVACALRLQLAPLSPISLRIGLHTGEVQLRDEANYVGPTINRTAGLRDLAHGGQTVLSATTSDLLADGLPADAWMLDLGTHPLRDLPRPERVTQLCHADLRNDFPPLRVSKTSATQHLPPQFTSFVGRGGEIEAVRQMIANNRLVTLTGAGGVGKTRLALQVAAKVAGEFEDGVWYVDLAPITDAAVVPVAVTRALELARALGDDWSLSQILGFQAFAAITGKGDAIAARASGEEGRDVADSIGDGNNSRMCRWCVALAQQWEGDVTGAIVQFRVLVAESAAAHDELWRMSSLVSLGHSLAFVGDTSEARAAATAAVEATADLGPFNQGFAYAALAVANLAAGDVEASSNAGEAAWHRMRVQPELAVVNVIPLAQVALARGDLTAARRWADDAVSVAQGIHRVFALATRARVAIAQNDPDQAEQDAHDALTGAANVKGYFVIPDVLECSPHLRSAPALTKTPRTSSEPHRHFAAAPARCASRSTTLPMTRRWLHCGRPWATTNLRTHGPRVRLCPPKRRSPMHNVAAANANDRQQVGSRLHPPNSTS